MIASELLCNASKYAYSNGGAGEIRITVSLDPSLMLTLIVADDGCGID